MAYYDALIAKWPSVAGATRTEKLANLNAETVTGAVPTIFSITAPQIYNCLAAAEFSALTAGQQQSVRDILNLSGDIPAGTGTTVRTVLLSLFAANSATRANFAALAKAEVQPWWKINGYQSVICEGDIIAAGLS